MTQTPQTLTITLTSNQLTLLRALSAEHGLRDEVAELHVLLKYAASFYDALWDQSFDKSQDLLDRLGNEAHQEFVHGETKILVIDADELL